MNDVTVTIDDIRAAARTINGAVVRTPSVSSRVLSALSGTTLSLKMENLQYTASFKERGALVKLSSLGAAERGCGVIAMSAGNHALGVAYHAERLGIPATIVMPRGTPFVKVAHTRNFGARVILHGDGFDAAAEEARRLAKAEGLTFVHPFDDEAIIAGQGTIALEMLDDVPDLEMLVAPIGGGGLIAGCAIAAKAVAPRLKVIGVQSALYPSMLEATRGGGTCVGGQTIAEGIAVKTAGLITRRLVDQFVDDILTVSESDIERAILALIEIEKTVAEGAGAAGLAAVLAHAKAFAGRRVGVIICGGNIDSRLLASILMRGLVRDGRLVQIRVVVGDAPGALARVTNILGVAEANIVELSHQRLFHDVPIRMVELDVVVETRDREHVRDILDQLGAGGFPARLLSDPAAV